MKTAHIEIFGGKSLHGIGTKILVNGVELHGVRALRIRMGCDRISTVSLQVVASVTVRGVDAEVRQITDLAEKTE